MQAIKDLVKDVKPPPTTKNSDYCVKITHIYNPTDFYVRSLKFSFLINYIEMTTPSKDVSIDNALFSNKIILFNLNSPLQEPKYARGKIVEVGDSGCGVFALDYGYYKENVPYELMWECDECLIDMEPLAVNCRLANCALRDKCWGYAINLFREYVADDCAHMVIVDNTSEQLIVTLDNSRASDLASALASSHLTTFGFEPYDLNKITLNATPPTKALYKFKQLKLNDVLHVRVVSGRSLDGFYAAEINDYHAYLKEQEIIDYYSTKAGTVEKDSMECGDSVLIPGESGSYDRGFIKKLYSDSDYVHVQMVDTGIDKRVHLKNLKITPEDCVFMPAIAIYCSVKEKVMLFQPGTEFVIVVQEIGKQLYFETPNLVTILHFDKNEKRRLKSNFTNKLYY